MRMTACGSPSSARASISQSQGASRADPLRHPLVLATAQLADVVRLDAGAVGTQHPGWIEGRGATQLPAALAHGARAKMPAHALAAHRSDRAAPRGPAVLAAQRAGMACVVGQLAASAADRTRAFGEQARLALATLRADRQRQQSVRAGRADVGLPIACLARDRLDLAADPTAPRTSLLKARVAQVTWMLLRRAGDDLADPAAPVAAPGRVAVPVAPGAQARPTAAAANAQFPQLAAAVAAVGRCAAVVATNAQRPTVRRPSLDPAGLAADLAAPPTARVGGSAAGALVRLIGVRALLDQPRRTAHPTAANAVTINDPGHAS